MLIDGAVIFCGALGILLEFNRLFERAKRYKAAIVVCGVLALIVYFAVIYFGLKPVRVPNYPIWRAYV